MAVFFLVLFLIVEALGVPFLEDPSPWLERGGPSAALAGVGLLLVDVALPVPSSLVMILHGALFGVVVGTGLSLIGGTGATLTGFALGRYSGPFISRWLAPGERARVERLLDRWGALAIVVTRPVPILAETTAILAGASSLSWRRTALAALVGCFPAALLYALTGAVAAGFASGALAFAVVMLAAALFWAVERLAGRRWQRPRRTRR